MCVCVWWHVLNIKKKHIIIIIIIIIEKKLFCDDLQKTKSPLLSYFEGVHNNWLLINC